MTVKKNEWNVIGDDPKNEPDPDPVDDPIVPFGTYVSKSIRDRLKILAATQGRKMRFLVEKALTEYLEREETK